MSVVLRCVAVAGVMHDPAASPAGLYLRGFDPEFDNGAGLAEWTSHPDKAMRFAGNAEAVAAWNTVPASRPLRADGRPNRPLTAYTMITEQVPA